MPKLFIVVMLAVLAWPALLNAQDAPGVSEWIRELRSVNAKRRVQAAESLARLGPAAAPAVKALVSALSDQNDEVRSQSLLALKQIGRGARDAVPALIEILKGEDASRLAGAVDALAAIGSDAGDAAPELLGFVHSDDQQLALASCRALLRILPADREELQEVIPVLSRALKTQDQLLRAEAVTTLGSAGPIAVAALVKLVDASATDPESAGRAASALALLGPDAGPAVKSLVKALQSTHEALVVQATEALSSIGSAAGPAVPQLRKLLYGKSVTVRSHAVRALGDIGHGSADAVTDMAALLSDRDENLRREAAEALGKIGPAALPAMPALIAALRDQSEPVKWLAAWALGRIGSKAVAPLIALLEDDKAQGAAIVALGDIGPAARPAVRPLVGLLSKPGISPELGSEVILALSRIGPAAGEAVPTLLKILADEKSELRSFAAWALARIGAKPAIPLLVRELRPTANSDLGIVAPIAILLLNPDDNFFFNAALQRVIELLTHESDAVRQEAAGALASVGKKAAPAVGNLAAGLADSDPATRAAFLSALAAIGPDSAAALPVIIQSLADPVHQVRYAASYAVGSIGAEAKVTAPLLEHNLLDKDPLLQFVSAWALVRVDPQRKGLAEICIEPLKSGLKNDVSRVRKEAAETLGLLGPDAKNAVPDLENLAQDADEGVHKSASEALLRIGAPKAGSSGGFFEKLRTGRGGNSQ